MPENSKGKICTYTEEKSWNVLKRKINFHCIFYHRFRDILFTQVWLHDESTETVM